MEDETSKQNDGDMGAVEESTGNPDSTEQLSPEQQELHKELHSGLGEAGIEIVQPGQ